MWISVTELSRLKRDTVLKPVLGNLCCGRERFVPASEQVQRVGRLRERRPFAQPGAAATSELESLHQVAERVLVSVAVEVAVGEVEVDRPHNLVVVLEGDHERLPGVGERLL